MSKPKKQARVKHVQSKLKAKAEHTYPLTLYVEAPVPNITDNYEGYIDTQQLDTDTEVAVYRLEKVCRVTVVERRELTTIEKFDTGECDDGD